MLNHASRILKNRLANAHPAFLFALIPLAAWWQPLVTGRALFYDVLYKLFFPNQEFFRRSILSGVFPLWNPFIYSGVPFAANMQSAVFYPFTYVSLLLDYPRMLAFNTCVHTGLAGVFMYFLAKSMGRSKTGAIVSALAFSLNGNFILRYAFPSHFHSYVWLPLILLAYHKQNLKIWQAWLCGSMALSLQLFAGHPQYLMYSFLAQGIGLVFAENKKRWLAILLGITGLFAILAAVQLVPTAVFSGESVRSTAARTSVFGFDWAMANSIRPSEFLVMLLSPQWNYFFTPTSGDPHIVGFYFGPILLICAALSLKTKWSSSRVFWGMTLLGILLSFGRYFPLYPLIYESFSIFQSFRFPSQAMYLVCFGIAILAGIGADLAPPKLRRWLPVLAAADLLFFAWRGTVLMDPIVYRSVPATVTAVGSDADLPRIMLTPRTRSQLSMTGRGEADAWLNFKNTLYPNFPMAYGLYAADGQEELRYARYEKILDAIDSAPLSPWIDIVGIKYVFSYWGLPTKFLVAAKTPTVNIFRNPSPLPKSYVVFDSIQIPDDRILDYVRRMGSQSLRKTVVLPESPVRRQKCATAKSTTEILDYSSQSLAIAADSPCPGWLVLGDAYDPGWQATVNATPTKVFRVNLAQRAVEIPAGKSLVRYNYRPRWFFSIALLSGISWLTGFLLLIL